jgi:hypothetical protein
LLTRMTGISLHMQWPLTSQLHGSVPQREQFFVTDQAPSPDHLIVCFRANLLDHVMYRMGVLAVLRAKLKKGAEIPLRL